MRALVLAVAVLASVPWQGIAFTDHTFTRVVPLGNTGFTVLQRRFVPICMHLDWKMRRSMQPPTGTLIASIFVDERTGA